MRGVILAAGQGTRMRPLTKHRPKPLVPVLGTPMVAHIIKGFAAAGVSEICLVIGYCGDMIEAAIGDGSAYGADVVYRYQDTTGGTGDALLYARDFIGDEDFFLSWGDIMVPPENYRGVVERYRNGDCDGVLTANWVDDPYEGAAVYAENGYLSRIEEKPPKGTATTNYNNAGIFILPGEIIPLVASSPVSARGELEVPTAILTFVENGGRLAVEPITGYWNDVARPGNVLKLQRMMLEHLRDDGVIIADSARVSPEARIQGPVWIGCNAEIGAAQIGPNAVIGEDCTVGDRSMLSDCTLFRGAQCGNCTTVENAILTDDVVLADAYEIIGADGVPACLFRTR